MPSGLVASGWWLVTGGWLPVTGHQPLTTNEKNAGQNVSIMLRSNRKGRILPKSA